MLHSNLPELIDESNSFILLLIGAVDILGQWCNLGDDDLLILLHWDFLLDLHPLHSLNSEIRVACDKTRTLEVALLLNNSH